MMDALLLDVRYAVRPYAVGALVIFTATGAAALVPSRRVSRVDAAAALRAE